MICSHLFLPDPYATSKYTNVSNVSICTYNKYTADTPPPTLSSPKSSFLGEKSLRFLSSFLQKKKNSHLTTVPFYFSTLFSSWAQCPAAHPHTAAAAARHRPGRGTARGSAACSRSLSLRIRVYARARADRRRPAAPLHPYSTAVAAFGPCSAWTERRRMLPAEQQPAEQHAA